MKATFVCTLLGFIVLVAPHAYAVPHAKRHPHVRASIVTHSTKSARVVPEPKFETVPGEIRGTRKIIADLRATFPGFADELLNDPRFHFDMRVITGYVPILGGIEEQIRKEKKSKKSKLLSLIGIHAKPKPSPMYTDFAIQSCQNVVRGNLTQFAGIEKQFHDKKTSVGREQVMAILDAENVCGTGFLGENSIAQTYFTLAVFKPNVVKKGWALQELKTFFALAKAYQFAKKPVWHDPLSIVGSNRGGMGYGQFIPSAYMARAMIARNGRCLSRIETSEPSDPRDMADAACSVANYLFRTRRKGYASYILYNHSRGYALSCAKAAKIFETALDDNHLMVARK